MFLDFTTTTKLYDHFMNNTFVDYKRNNLGATAIQNSKARKIDID